MLACRTTSTQTASADGLVVTPMLDVAEVSDAAAAEPDASDAAVARPATEPRAPQNQTCKREVHCIPQSMTIPTPAYAHPFEHCEPTPYGEAGKFSASETTSKRAQEADVCCYLEFTECVSRGGGGIRRNPQVRLGRPLRNRDGKPELAGVAPRDGWTIANEPEKRLDSRLSTYFAASAVVEHASVAEFARLSLELLALGAPADLIADVHRAALDEIAHAQTCFTLASRFGVRAVGPTALAMDRITLRASVLEVALATLRDGCLGESLSALELFELARAEADVEVAAALEKMARDEESHAALAWRIIRFALDTSREEALSAIATFRRELETPQTSALAREVVRDIVLPLLGSVSALA